MEFQIRFPIRIKLLLLMTLLVVFSILTYLGLAIKLFQDDKRVLIYELNSGAVKTISAELKSDLRNAIGRVNLLTQGYRDPQWLATLFANEEEILSFSIYRREGETLAREANLSRAKTYLEPYGMPEAGFDAVLSPEFLGQAFPSSAPASTPEEAGAWKLRNVSAGGVPLLALYRQAQLQGEANPKYVVALLRGDRWLELLRQRGVATLMVVDERGELLAHTDPKLALDRVSPKASFPLVEEALGSRLPLQMKESLVDGKKALAAYADVGVGGLKVFSYVPEDQVFRAAFRLVNKSLLFGLFIVTIALFLSIRVARGLTQPLWNLVRGTQKLMRWEFEPIPVSSRDEVGALGQAFNTMGRDLIDQRNKIETMQRQLVLSERMAAIGQVARGVGHEFGNILMRVMGKIDLAQADSKEPNVKAHLDVALQALERSAVILQNLRSFSKTEAKLREARISEVFAQARSLTAHEMRIGNVALEEKIDFDPTIEADDIGIGQVILNLMINAQHAIAGVGGAEGGSAGGKIVFAMSEATHPKIGHALRIDVQDSGMGIPEANLPRIFDFAYTTKGEKGSGLGLSVSKEIIERQGGEITVKSKVGEGTVFSIFLPVGRSGRL